LKYKKLKFEFILVFIITSIISGVLLWFILDNLEVIASIEISVLISLSLISGIIIYSLHGRGILPEPVTNLSLYLEKPSQKYYRKKFRLNAFSRENYHHSLKQRNKKSSIFGKRFLAFQYIRTKYRN